MTTVWAKVVKVAGFATKAEIALFATAPRIGTTHVSEPDDAPVISGSLARPIGQFRPGSRSAREAEAGRGGRKGRRRAGKGAARGVIFVAPTNRVAANVQHLHLEATVGVAREEDMGRKMDARFVHQMKDCTRWPEEVD